MVDITAQRLKSLRERKDWSQPDLEGFSGVGQSHISRIEQGKAPGTSGIVLAKLATALETSTDYLVGLVDDPNPRPITNHPALIDPRLRAIADHWPELDEDFQQALYDIVAVYLTRGQSKEMPR